MTGHLHQHEVHSTILSTSPTVWVYTPPGFAPRGGPYALLVLFDGWEYVHLVPTTTILDNLLVERRVPPLVAVLVGHQDRGRDLGCSPPFLSFVADELVPWMQQNYAVSGDPAMRVVGGSSLGGLAAAFAGLQRPDVFGQILSLSGGFSWKPADDPEFEWLTRQFVACPVQALRFYLTVGTLDSRGGAVSCPSLLVAHRHMRDVLQAKGYPLHYVEFSGGHDYICWQEALADGIITLLGEHT